jgi:hypothetical protein
LVVIGGKSPVHSICESTTLLIIIRNLHHID